MLTESLTRCADTTQSPPDGDESICWSFLEPQEKWPAPYRQHLWIPRPAEDCRMQMIIHRPTTDCWFFRHPLALAPRSHVRSLACHTDRAPCGLFIFTTPFPTLLGVVVFCYFRSVPLEIFKLPSPSPKHPASVGNRARALDPSTCVHNCYRIQAFGMNTGLPPMGSPHRRRGEIYRRR